MRICRLSESFFQPKNLFFARIYIEKRRDQGKWRPQIRVPYVSSLIGVGGELHRPTSQRRKPCPPSGSAAWADRMLTGNGSGSNSSIIRAISALQRCCLQRNTHLAFCLLLLLSLENGESVNEYAHGSSVAGSIEELGFSLQRRQRRLQQPQQQAASQPARKHSKRIYNVIIGPGQCRPSANAAFEKIPSFSDDHRTLFVGPDDFPFEEGTNFWSTQIKFSGSKSGSG